MKCKTSCFNPSLAGNDLRRFWPLPVCSFFLFLCFLVLPYYTYLREITQSGVPAAAADGISQAQAIAIDAASHLSSQYYLLCVLLAGAALVSAMLLFHHLHSRREIQFYLGLPVRRSGLFGTCAIMGFLLVALPLLLSQLVILGISVSFGVGAQASLRYLAGSLLAYLCFYGMALVACVMAGQSFGAFLLYCGMHGAVAAIWLGACQVGQCFIPGFDGSAAETSWIFWLIPLAQLMRVGYYTMEYISGVPVMNAPTSSGLDLHAPLIYGLVGLVLIVLAAVLYQYRKAETAGETISFPWTRWLSKVMAALAVGLGGTLLILVTLYSSHISFGTLLAMVLVLTAIGWIAAEMIIWKSFRIIKAQSVIPCGILLLLTAALMLGARADMTGYIHRIPDQSEVSSTSVVVNFNYVPVDFEDAHTVHALVLDHIDELSTTANGDNISVAVSYGLKDGKTLDRTYYIPTEDENLTAQINEIIDKKENVYSALFTGWPEDPDALTFRDTVISAYPVYVDGESSDTPAFARDGSSDAYGDFPLTAQEAQALYHAICQDIADGNMLSPCHQYLADDDRNLLGSLSLSLWDPVGAVKAPRESSWYANIDIYESMTHTIAAMKDMGFQFR